MWLVELVRAEASTPRLVVASGSKFSELVGEAELCCTSANSDGGRLCCEGLTCTRALVKLAVGFAIISEVPGIWTRGSLRAARENSSCCFFLLISSHYFAVSADTSAVACSCVPHADGILAVFKNTEQSFNSQRGSQRPN